MKMRLIEVSLIIASQTQRKIISFDSIKIFTHELNGRVQESDIQAYMHREFRPGLSLKPGLEPQNGFKSYVYLKT